jgi:hypothetical protein
MQALQQEAQAPAGQDQERPISLRHRTASLVARE